ncbi:MAG TPA: O-antigen ligase family protein, partial [Anaerolineaceae bacterium]|nr:O-antigen ligase family protein [Anaerolineaceae bacterium]
MTPRAKTWIFLACLILAFGVVYGTLQLQAVLPLAAVFIGLGIFVTLGWLIRRGLMARAALPKTGLEIPLLVFFIGVTVSLLVSPAPRSGLERLAWYLAAGVLFYFLVDLLGQPERRAGLRAILMAAVLIVTATTLLAALLETYARYLVWWREVGSQAVMPPFQIRFSSLAGHPNIFQALMNLVAPTALLTLVRTKRRAVRVFAAGWLVMYLLALPFTSSRGGWVGAAAWVGILMLVWLLDGGRWQTFLSFLRRRLAIILPAGAALVVLGGLAALRFYQVFAGSHPTHGSGFSLNREGIWDAALAVWEASPWTGSGLARLGLEMLRTAPNYPDRWWAVHAHSVPVNFLGETGLVGALPLLLLTVAAAVLLVRQVRRAEGAERLWAGASLAALVSLFVHGIFDNFSNLPYILVLLVLHAALVLTATGPAARFQRIPLLTLAAPALAVAVMAVFYLWSYAPHYRAASQEVASWQAAALASAESARRDPALALYPGQAGLAYAQAWGEDHNPEHLARAQRYLEQALALEPNHSVYWANLSMLRWHAGQPEQAIAAIEQAIALCPTETSFFVQSGWFFEQTGDRERALQFYGQALALNPNLAAHPFWSDGPVRAAATAGLPAAPGSDHWAMSQQALAAGD